MTTEAPQIESTIGPRKFLVIGVTLFALKYLIDRWVASLIFGRPWSLLNYLIPLEGYSFYFMPRDERTFYATMLLIAAPFVWIGLRVTRSRLRDANLPLVLLILFFFPAMNLLFFATLSFLPSSRREEEIEPEAPPAGDPPSDASRVLDYGRNDNRPPGRICGTLFPPDEITSALSATFVPVPFSLAITYFAVNVLQEYGLGVFIAMPFALGLIAAILHGYSTPRTLRQCMTVACTSFMASAGAIFLFAIEGIGCLLMLLPLALPVVVAGGALGYTIQKRPRTTRDDRITGALWSIVLVSALLPALERVAHPPATLYAVTTCVDVNAPPGVAWSHVVSFGDIPKPTDWIFRAGVAYPVRAVISGSGKGAIRRCKFSTGAFIEPIEIWDAPHLLKFAVTDNPPPMREWSPFNVNAPHLHDFLTARHGQFRLIDLGGGRTRIEGATWYQHHMWPEMYWRLWSDAIVHRIHLRVLEHIKRESEDVIATADGRR